MILKQHFEEEFLWGVSSSAFQTEGAFLEDGKGLSNWDHFSSKRRKIKNKEDARKATNFYKNYATDLDLIQGMGIKNFRFSVAWSRVLPNGIGKVNTKGLDFYDRLIDGCLERGINPWLTLYHWDLPFALERKGGWQNRDVVNWFTEYIALCEHKYSDRVKNWMILNEPTAFTALGYFMGIHAPGKKGIKNFLPTMHHASMAQAEGGRVLKELNGKLTVGTTFSFSHIESRSAKQKDRKAQQKVDALLNRLYLEPLLGLGYPLDKLEGLREVEKYILEGDMERLAFDFDFIGVQNYGREVVAHSYLTPIVRARLISAKKRKKERTAMNWEYYPEGIYQVLKSLGKYENIPPIIITESGVALHDELTEEGSVHDQRRIEYLQRSIASVERAKKEGVNVGGYFVWSLTDNFEWAEGYKPRFGLVYVDYKNQKRVPKDSAKWYSNFLKASIY